jgi:glycosyltransferase involved in cell wall biosynthesis
MTHFHSIPVYPLVTIAIPTFNRAGLLKECVAAALSQTYPHFEVLVSNNASTDDTRHVLNEFDDPRLRVIHQEANIGLGPNWVACQANAKGDFIVFVSDDDRIAPWMLERCAALIRQQPDLPAVVTLSNLHAASIGRTKLARASQSHATGIWDGAEILAAFLTDRITVTMCSVLMNTRILRERGGYPLDLPHTADVAAWAPLLLLGKAGLVNEACATFTYHSMSETSRLGVEQLLHDGSKVADLIARAADIHVTDPKVRESIQLEARRCFARRGLIALSDSRTSGTGVRALLNDAWRLRRDLGGVDLKAILRFIAVVSCPAPLAAQLRQLLRA